MAYRVTFTVQKNDALEDTLKPEAANIFNTYMDDGRVLEGYITETDDPTITKNTITFINETVANTYFAEFEALTGGTGLNGHNILNTETETI